MAWRQEDQLESVDNGSPRRPSWRRYGGLSVLAVGVVGGAILTTLAAGAVYAPKPPGGGCGWGNLKGDLPRAPELVLAFDRDLNVQGFHRPGGGPAGSPGKDDALQGTVDVQVDRYNPKTCYKIGGVEYCVSG